MIVIIVKITFLTDMMEYWMKEMVLEVGVGTQITIIILVEGIVCQLV